MVRPKVMSTGEVDRLWQWLRQRTDRIVVLADGLEEILNDESVRGERDNLIRDAIREAGQAGAGMSRFWCQMQDRTRDISPQ
jgi:hypothetical protein